MLVLLAVLPVSAWMSDRFGRKPLLISGSAVLAIGAVPFFYLIHTAEPFSIFVGECGFVPGIGLLSGGVAAVNVELMTHAIRGTGRAFAYNASLGLLGGTTPLISTWLIAKMGDPIAPAFWGAAAGVISLLTAIFWVRETKHEPLC